MPSSTDSFAETLASCVTIDDFEEAARARLPPMAFDYYRSGADEDSPRPRGRTSPPPPRSDLAVLAETCAPLPLVVKGLVRGDDARAALGLGARAVFVGRPVLWGLGAAGEAGVARVLAGGSGPPLAPAALIAAIVAAAATIRSSEVGYSTATPRRIFASVEYAKQSTAGAPDLEKTTMQTSSSTEGTTPARTTTWTIDGSHTNATFSVRHLRISNVRGELQKVSGAVTYDPAKPEATLVKVEADVSSSSTREPQRDTHLRSADFFDVANHPTITFESTSLRRADKNLELVGKLTIRGTTREVVLAIDGPTPKQTDPWETSASVRRRRRRSSALIST